MTAIAQIVLDPGRAKPLYEQLADALRARILQGEFKAEDPLPSINALVERVNASRITVIRALKELAAQGLIFSRGRQGYFVNARTDPMRVGFVVPLHTVFMSIYSKLHATLQLAAWRRLGRLEVASSQEDPRVFRDRITEMVHGQGIRKLAVVPPNDSSQERVHPDCLALLREVAALPDMRIVVLDREVAPEGFTVLRQNRESGYRQVLSLVNGYGYRAPLFVDPAPELERVLSVLGGRSPAVHLHWSEGGRPSAERTMEAALAAGADIVIMEDLPAALLLEHYGSVPFGLVGYNGSDFVDASPVRMTYVDSNLREMGRIAFQVLETGRRGEDILIDPLIRVGDTTPRMNASAGGAASLAPPPMRTACPVQ